MNYLAHVWLAGSQPAIRVGGLLGDFVRGPLPGALPAELAQGVALHRFIDSAADQHPLFLQSRQRISPARRRYAGILIDLAYDHFLASEWSRFASQPLGEFTQALYQQLDAFVLDWPERFRPVQPSLVARDWLASYAHFDSLARAIDNISRYRLSRANPLLGAAEEITAHYAELKADCLAFLPDMAVQCQHWLASRH